MPVSFPFCLCVWFRDRTQGRVRVTGLASPAPHRIRTLRRAREPRRTTPAPALPDLIQPGQTPRLTPPWHALGHPGHHGLEPPPQVTSSPRRSVRAGPIGHAGGLGRTPRQPPAGALGVPSPSSPEHKSKEKGLRGSGQRDLLTTHRAAEDTDRLSLSPIVTGPNPDQSRGRRSPVHDSTPLNSSDKSTNQKFDSDDEDEETARSRPLSN